MKKNSHRSQEKAYSIVTRTIFWIEDHITVTPESFDCLCLIYRDKF